MDHHRKESAVLGAVAAGETYGLEVMDRVREATGGEIQLGQGDAYPILRALERRGLLTSREGDPLPERGRRPRRYYTITDAGREWLLMGEAARKPKAGD